MAFIIADRVKETSTTTGTGALALSGAMTGFQSFASKCAVGDTVYYGLQAVDGTGSPTGEWECGLGTYSGANTLIRTTVTASSTGSILTLADGAKQVYITMPAAQVAWVRERLAAARTYYVRTDGSDSNTGLANTAGGAFLTIQAAITVVAKLDFNGYAVTIQVADGTYAGVTNVSGPFMLTGGSLTITGNAGTPSNVIIGSVSAGQGGAIAVTNLKISSATSFCLYATTKGYISFSNLVFGSATAAHIRAAFGGFVSAAGNYTIAASAPAHLQAILSGVISVSSKTVTLTGTPAFSTAFAQVETCGVMDLYNNTYSGAATGSRYSVTLNSTIQTYTGNATLLPGSTAGTTATGGQYA